MRYIRPFQVLNESVSENFLEDFISTFTDLVDDGYKLEFRNPYGVNAKFQDYIEKNQTWQKFSSSISSANIKQVGVFINTLNSDYDGYSKLVDDNPYGVNAKFQDYIEKNQTWQKFSSSISSANIKQVGVFINTLNSDYDGYSKLVDDMRPVIVSLDDIGWNFIGFGNSIRDLEFRGNLYTFQNDAKSTRPKSISDKEIKDFINNKGFSVDEIERSEDPDWDGEVVEVQFGSQAYDGLIPSNIDDIVHGISTSLGFHDYIIQRKTNYTVLVQFYL